MDSQKLLPLFPILSLFLFALLAGPRELQVSASPLFSNKFSATKKLFVFGDSYADTGNVKKSIGNSWKHPYGITFPGKPAGRFSDGRVFTDYIAKFLGLKSPMALRWERVAPHHLKEGVNFAYGGTGVFDTSIPGPNMTTQIDSFQNLINRLLFSATDLHSSIALLSVAGNDYATYADRNGSTQGYPALINAVVNQMTANLRRIHGLGVRKIAVTSLEPIGCLPMHTALFSYKQCDHIKNHLAGQHNIMLRTVVDRLNKETNSKSFVYIDLYTNFQQILNGLKAESSKFQALYKPCCIGVSREYSCGSIDENGVKKYFVCDHPEATFFWDSVHPTQEGWNAVYHQLRETNSLTDILT
ncbi:GDSL esterase/lipase family [Quillaja saponaria]|uniref:GDSL esterase/lipase family n=1 Tax=Quillaja saponaria TaxID=32244 RepID=A0AAD7VD50_QUISA|nr:GDSL esterase/lipase family [Quillaja saponaria]